MRLVAWLRLVLKQIARPRPCAVHFLPTEPAFESASGHYLELLDTRSIPGYLETDKDFNVTFYEKFGFKTKKELEVLGVTTWLMWSDA